MFQESVDRSGNSSRNDMVLIILLIVVFFSVGAIALYLEKLFDSKAPRYIFIGIMLIAIYLVYRMRIVGFRYTIFYKDPEPEYDPRFDDIMLHEDYPYPVGTIVFEKIVSAKGNVLAAIAGDELVAFLRPGEKFESTETIADSLNAACVKPSKAYSLVYRQSGKLRRVYFRPSEEFISYVNIVMTKKAGADILNASEVKNETAPGTEAVTETEETGIKTENITERETKTPAEAKRVNRIK